MNLVEYLSKELKVGDYVQIKSWEELESISTYEYENDLKLPDDVHFHSGMRELCGLKFAIQKIIDWGRGTSYTGHNSTYSITAPMIKKVIPK